MVVFCVCRICVRVQHFTGRIRDRFGVTCRGEHMKHNPVKNLLEKLGNGIQGIKEKMKCNHLAENKYLIVDPVLLLQLGLGGYAHIQHAGEVVIIAPGISRYCK